MSKDQPASVHPARRAFLRQSLTLIPVATLAGTGLGGAVLADSATQAPAEPARAAPARAYQPRFFTQEEWAFVSAAVAVLIPTDALGPGAADAGVPEFIDRQLNTRYGSGGLWYMQGPFRPDAPSELGYQLKLSPQEIYRLGIAETDAWCQAQFGKAFARLGLEQQQQVLEALDGGKPAFASVPAATFLGMLWLNTREGFFSDPLHGGNQGLAGWKLVGFPGARADFMDWVERDERYPFPSVSISGERG
ncbi:gluconate 2-dehydrogenase subunit 3 family protein [Pseudomonas mosselii]|uniref:gluconate 2-dehydrogenase subunit 3 family protein n=1 Tax=Pseudomonas mosselii TaxID=78327 RepID=UPI0007705122|nr:gluconate 2-dehydrogenase subunit 3 family protein [Pseudomonas mosselii]AMK30952.1 Gluconate 2-dehydrogenase [Pseudomonas putida]MBC3453252.1 gluconate 2-dehydrogenase subunit 3 family protein [Pseudomonas mosselii]MDH1655915.1 gluconate 2-dehydrogenase subunit 3 family protein [Pseudomonas mosselii]MDH1718656.1 gluconate 2-dehydrogenase subunit 3 family protein [Pseudomonas mosselii]MDH1723802.1 gluconate 2-dehydrogenase subunit 3 family protein [Pseudomonas mosselii]